MATKLTAPDAGLYDADFYVWARRQAEALRAGRLDELDLEHLAEEVDDLAARSRSAVQSRTATIIEHLLKLQFSPAQDPRNKWRATLRTQRRDLGYDLTPALRRELSDMLGKIYEQARKDAAEAMQDHGEDQAADGLPATCPYTLDQITGNWHPK